MTEFIPFPKIARLRRECIVTEKIDGTNAQVIIEPYVHGTETPDGHIALDSLVVDGMRGMYRMRTGSRNRFITPEKDNHGFSKWASENASELFRLGPGRHYGEWWGQGIQRGYGLKEKRFSLFNVSRWGNPDERPKCCDVVPVLGRCLFSDEARINGLFRVLEVDGSFAAPGFMQPEGIVVFHVQSGALFKRTFESDVEGKGQDREAAQALIREVMV